jgi:glucose-6-phosphate-specific signal transduction histidine kinase
LDTFFRSQPKPVIAGLALGMIALISWIDSLTGWQISLGVFYGIPVLFVVWYMGKDWAIAFAGICMLGWMLSNWGGIPNFSRGAFIWAAISRLVYFISMAIGGAAVRKQREIDAARIAALEHARALERDIVNVSEREQRRIGQDIHDGLCQVLAGIGCATAMLKEELQAKSLPEAKSAEEIEAYIQEAATEARDLARGIFPVLQDPSGLESALEELAIMTSRLHQRQVDVHFEEGITIPNPEVSMHLYRIAQEAVSNALKHADAQGVCIRVANVGGILRLTVQDDGPGVPSTVFSSSTGMGLRTMKYRAGLIGAELEIGRGPEGGTLVSCNMPYIKGNAVGKPYGQGSADDKRANMPDTANFKRSDSPDSALLRQNGGTAT